MIMNVNIISYISVFIICFHAIKTDYIGMKSKLSRKIRIPKKEKHYPYFNEILPSRIHTTTGNAAILACIVENITNESISWIRSRDLHILTVDDYVFTTDRRFEIFVESPTNWTLKVNNAQLEDSGVYECQISTQPVSTFSVYLAVLDTYFTLLEQSSDYGMEINEEGKSSDDTAHLRNTPVDEPQSTKILQGSKILIREGGVLNITCDVFLIRKNVNSPPLIQWDQNLYLIWFHNDNIISDKTSHNGTMVLTKNSSTLLRSRLIIFNTYFNDSGNYTCHPIGLKKAVIQVNVINDANIRNIVPCYISLFLIILFLVYAQ